MSSAEGTFNNSPEWQEVVPRRRKRKNSESGQRVLKKMPAPESITNYNKFELLSPKEHENNTTETLESSERANVYKIPSIFLPGIKNMNILKNCIEEVLKKD